MKKIIMAIRNLFAKKKNESLEGYNPIFKPTSGLL